MINWFLLKLKHIVFRILESRDFSSCDFLDKHDLNTFLDLISLRISTKLDILVILNKKEDIFFKFFGENNHSKMSSNEASNSILAMLNYNHVLELSV